MASIPLDINNKELLAVTIKTSIELEHQKRLNKGVRNSATESEAINVNSEIFCNHDGYKNVTSKSNSVFLCFDAKLVDLLTK